MNKMISLGNTSENKKRQFKYYLLYLDFPKPLVKRAIDYLAIETEEEAMKSLTILKFKWQHNFILENIDNYHLNDKCLVCNDLFSNHTIQTQQKRSHSINNPKNYMHTSTNKDEDDIVTLPKPKLRRKKSLPDIKVPTEVLNISRYCNICLDNDTDILTIPCGHKFCKGCITMHLHEKINCRVLDTISCPEKDCAFIFDESLIYQFITEEYKNKYQCFKRRNEIDKIPNAKYCPFPNCDSYALLPSTAATDNAINKTNEIINIIIDVRPNENNQINQGKDKEKSKSKEQQELVLVCIDNGHRFCGKCNQQEHPGLKCDMKIEKDFVAWKKSANARKCPKCKADIEKIGGCNHMTCTKVNCGYQFCWICMGKYSNRHFTNPLSPCFGLQNSDQFSHISKCRRLILCLRYLGLVMLFFIALALVFAWPGLPLMVISGMVFMELIYENRMLMIICIGTYFCLSIALMPFAYILLAGLFAAIPVILVAVSIYFSSEYI